MAKKPARIYRTPKKRLYTRKEYMKGIPGPKITIFEMGELSNPEKFELEMSLVAKEEGQIVHNALEAARIAANRHMVKRMARDAYNLKIRVFPHVVLRENKQATGAGADRVSDGMSRSFGKPVGVAARVRKGQKIMTIRTSPARYQVAKDALRRAKVKFPVPCSITIDRGKELLKL
ncbi:MAG: 50S ribosomal protein L16 [Euryarchaeota archaeon]|nr:50S ribosomal protein L16 [Euryarchaeota archaeon]